ncbi:MAG: agmatine deiminase family protein [Acidimicrobiales bacterium]|nr:agmatine deiminase family protein [Acidimicrobiales bacterium]
MSAPGTAGTPHALGLRMPAEADPHERTLLSWPPEAKRPFWGDHLEAARDAWAETARAVAAFEPVLVVADVGEGDAVAARLGDVPDVDVVELPLDDSWIRDNGPIVVTDGTGRRAGVHFGFNSWGGKHPPWDRDAELPAPLCEHLGLDRLTAPFVLEGGSIAVDGEGLLVTTERCLLHPNRNPTLTRAEIEEGLRDWLGIDRVLWLPDGLADDDETDGHVDNVVALPRPGTVLLQGCDDPDDADHATAAENRRRLLDAGLEVIEVPVLPRVPCFDRVVEVPYLNYYVCNGGVVVPVTGAPSDADVLEVIAEAYPGRDVVGVPGAVPAFGGGGVHCITQQVPRV